MRFAIYMQASFLHLDETYLKSAKAVDVADKRKIRHLNSQNLEFFSLNQTPCFP